MHLRVSSGLKYFVLMYYLQLASSYVTLGVTSTWPNTAALAWALYVR